MKLWKRLGAAALAVVTAVGLTLSSANACTSLFVGGALTENGSTFFGRGEDIGEHYAKIFQVIEAADHEEGEIYEDSAGFSMPYPAHTYRYTYVRAMPKRVSTSWGCLLPPLCPPFTTRSWTSSTRPRRMGSVSCPSPG